MNCDLILLDYAATFTTFKPRFTLMGNSFAENSASYLKQVITDTSNPPLAICYFCQEKSVVIRIKMFHHFVVETLTSYKENGFDLQTSLKVIPRDIQSDGKKYVLRGLSVSNLPQAIGYYFVSSKLKLKKKQKKNIK